MSTAIPGLSEPNANPILIAQNEPVSNPQPSLQNLSAQEHNFLPSVRPGSSTLIPDGVNKNAQLLRTSATGSGAPVAMPTLNASYSSLLAAGAATTSKGETVRFFVDMPTKQWTVTITDGTPQNARTFHLPPTVQTVSQVRDIAERFGMRDISLSLHDAATQKNATTEQVLHKGFSVSLGSVNANGKSVQIFATEDLNRYAIAVFPSGSDDPSTTFIQFTDLGQKTYAEALQAAKNLAGS